MGVGATRRTYVGTRGATRTYSAAPIAALAGMWQAVIEQSPVPD